MKLDRYEVHVDERYVFSRLGGLAWAGLATTIYVTIGVVVDRAAGLAAPAFLIVALFVGLTALSYTELTGMRDAKGRASPIRRARPGSRGWGSTSS